VSQEQQSPRVLVIGLDGATFRIMRPLLDAGRLPVLGRLIAEGASGILKSTIPPHSSVAWPSFATGKNPGKHGVFYVLNTIPGSYQRRLVNSQSVRALTLWDLLSLRQRTVGIMDVPITFPARPVRGFLLAGMMTPNEESLFTYPDSLYSELVQELGELPLEAALLPAAVRQGPVAALKAIVKLSESRRRAALYLMKSRPWDFFCVVFRGTDLIQHIMWRYMQEDLRALHPELSRKFEHTIEQFYIKMDRAVGELMAEAGPGVTTIVMSDHGMGPCRRNFYMNRWLEENGFLHRKPASIWRARRPRLRKRTVLPPVPPGRPAPRLRRWMGSTPLLVPELEYLGRHHEVDWSRTRAYANWTGGESMISINLRGREPQGIVSAGAEYDAVCQEITRGLLELRDPWDGGPVIEKVYRRDEIYQGPYVEEAPDLHLMPREFTYHARGEVRARAVLEKVTHRAPSLHDPDGIVIMQGAGIAPAAALEGARIIDVAPTVLHLLGLPVPDDMDGEVLEGAFHGEYRAAHPVTREPASAWVGEKARIYADDEERAVMDTLRGLGYVS
jgi:predicted AlkP superfamily phosphohydrolase/phosphomutase